MAWLIYSTSKEPSTKVGLLLNGKELKPKAQASFTMLQQAKSLETFQSPLKPALQKHEHYEGMSNTRFQRMTHLEFDQLKAQSKVEYKESIKGQKLLDPPFPTIRALTIRESIAQWEARRVKYITSKKFGASFFVAICLDIRASIENAPKDWQLPKTQHINPRWVESFMGLPSGWCNPKHKNQH